MKRPVPVETVEHWREIRRGLLGRGETIGFVPTMGALHAGHGRLCERAAENHPHVLVSIFVNPTQFDNPWDFQTYPRTLNEDIDLLAGCGATHVLVPTVAGVYPDEGKFAVTEREVSRLLEGVHRPGHFDGMLTIVLKLLQIAGADRAYFGEKDWQQLHLVRGLAKAWFLSTEIVAVPTVREPDGLAMSSRNRRLSAEERLLAPRFPEILRTAPSPQRAAEALRALGFEVDYVEEWDGRRLGAVRLGKTRLIDNFPIEACAREA